MDVAAAPPHTRSDSRRVLVRSTHEVLEPVSAVAQLPVPGFGAWIAACSRTTLCFASPLSPPNSDTSPEQSICLPTTGEDVFDWPAPEFGAPVGLISLEQPPTLALREQAGSPLALVVITSRGAVALVVASLCRRQAAGYPGVECASVEFLEVSLESDETVWAATGIASQGQVPGAEGRVATWEGSMRLSFSLIVGLNVAGSIAIQLWRCSLGRHGSGTCDRVGRCALDVPRGFNVRAAVSLPRLSGPNQAGLAVAVAASDGQQTLVTIVTVYSSTSSPSAVLRAVAVLGPWVFSASCIAATAAGVLIVGDSNSGRLLVLCPPFGRTEGPDEAHKPSPPAEIQLPRPAMAVTAIGSCGPQSLLVAALHEEVGAPAFVTRISIALSDDDTTDERASPSRGIGSP